jgi:hypothetical protein
MGAASGRAYAAPPPVPHCVRLLPRMLDLAFLRLLAGLYAHEFDNILTKHDRVTLIQPQRSQLAGIDQPQHRWQPAAQNLGRFLNSDGWAGRMVGLRFHTSPPRMRLGLHVSPHAIACSLCT